MVGGKIVPNDGIFSWWFYDMPKLSWILRRIYDGKDVDENKLKETKK